MLRAVLLKLSHRPAIGATMERLPATRQFVRRFVAGTTADEALAVLAGQDARGLAGAVTYLGENVTTVSQAEHAAAMYLHLVDEIARRRLRAVPSLKLTHLGLDLGDDVCVKNLTRILERAAESRTLVWIDMESSVYTDRTLNVYARLRVEYPTVACVVQAYLRRTAGDVERLIDLAATVRLCKGAYREPSSVAFAHKRDVDANYERLTARLLAPDATARAVYPGFATHDERMIAHVLSVARANGVGNDRFEIQMLYGIRRDLHDTLLARGVAVRVLVPFGEEWYGYFMRRLAERPANLLFFLRNLRARGTGGRPI